MNKLNIIPTPEYIECQKSDIKLSVKSIFIEKHLQEDCFEAIKFLPELKQATLQNADLIITDNKQTAGALDYSFFENDLAKEQGYIIKCDVLGKTVLYSPSVQGIMYAICTFIQLDNINTNFEIKDCPDFRYRGVKWLLWAETGILSYDFGDGKDAFLSRIERKLDICLKNKINMVFFDACGPDADRTPHYEQIMKKCTALARKRGIYLVFCAYTMGYGLSGHQFGKFYGKVYKNTLPYKNGDTYECLGTFIHDKRNGGKPYIAGREFGTCISNDAMTEDKISELCEFIRRVNPGALYLHNMDSCYVDPVLWNARCESCRKRWPNDDLFAKDGMAGAFAYYLDKINSALRSVKTENYDSSKDLLIFNVAPGYLEPKVEDFRVEDAMNFWAAVQQYQSVKQNVMPLFREMFYNKEDSRKRIADIASDKLSDKFGVISFAGSDGFYSDKPITLASMLSFMYKGASAVITCSGNAFAEPLSVINSQFMWNSDMAKAFDFPDNFKELMPLFLDIRTGKFRPDFIFEKGGLLYTVCQKLYGQNADKMFEFFSLCGRDGECPAPFVCNKELGTAGNNVLLEYRWDNILSKDEINSFARKFEQIYKLNKKAEDILSLCENDEDITALYNLLCDSSVFVKLLMDYMKLYAAADELITDGKGDKNALCQKADELICYAKEQGHIETDCIDAMGGAFARRGELFETLSYNLNLIKCSLESGKRIPDEAKKLEDEFWW